MSLLVPSVVHRSPFHPAIYQKARTCKKCGTIHPGKKPPAGWELNTLKA